MFLNSWSLGLSLSSLIVLFLGIMACRTAVRVLRFWDPASDGNRQIRLENEIWLASTLVEYALVFQIITLILFVLAADHFCKVIVGAMCATGALLANSWGVPALLVKLAGVFLYGFWIVLHHLDISSETYPLVRIKYFYLIFLAPLLLADITLQTLYIAKLNPDIITSCCAVVFGATANESQNLLGSVNQGAMLTLFYGTIGSLLIIGIIILRSWRQATASLFSLIWLFFLGLATVAVISVFSSYIYAMPFHHCPFCILKPEYYYIGFPIYGSLIGAGFFGISSAAVEPFKRKKDLAAEVTRYQTLAVKASLFLLMVFTVLCSYHYVLYRISGGES